MHRTIQRSVVSTFLTVAFALACSQPLMAGTTAPGSSDKGKGSKIEMMRDQAPAPQAIAPGPVPAELVVAGGGLEWVYASPCVEGGCSNPSPNNQTGWRYATYEELTQHFPSCSAFVGKCASQYFDPVYSHCDLGDCELGYICSQPGQLCVNGELAPAYGETFYVRGEAAPAIPVPVLSMAGVAVLVLCLVFLARRRVAV